MSDDQPSTPIHSGASSPEVHHDNNNHPTTSTSNNNVAVAVANDNNVVGRRERPSRACTARSAARLQAAAAAEAAVVSAVRKQKHSRKERRRYRYLPLEEEEEDDEPPPSPPDPFSNVMTSLVEEPPLSLLPRWNIRSLWELASILNFLNVFRHLLNITVEFSVEEFETALLMPNNRLADIHIPLLRAIPPVARMALGQNTWVTVLCRKLKDFWHRVAEGDLPIVALHGAEVEVYNTLDPGIRVLILKALCDVRVQQEDIRNYIDDSIKHGVPPSAFRKERTGGDSHGVSYWYEDDPMIGQRLYREIRKVEVTKGKGKSVQPIPNSCYQWETVATSMDEFQDVSEKLLLSKNRTEASLGKKLKIDMLPEIEKVHKKKEKQLKKQHRQALLLDNMMNVDELGLGCSRRGRKPVSYTFDDYDRSINEAIKITKRKLPSPEPTGRRDGIMKLENGRWDSTSQIPQNFSVNAHSPDSPDYDGTDEDHKAELLDCSNRRRQRPQRYSAREFVEAVSENEADFDSDDDIVGEAVYDEEYLRKRKEKRTVSSSSEGDEEYHLDGENAEEEEEEEEEEEGDNSSSASDESDQPRRFKKLPVRTRREAKLRLVDELQPGLRRSKRSTRNCVDYTRYELSESEPELPKPEKSSRFEKQTDTSASDNSGFSMGSEDTEDNEDNGDIEDNESDEDNEDNLDNKDNLDSEEMEIDQPVVIKQPETINEEQIQSLTKVNSPDRDEVEGGAQKRRFLDLNELAPGSGFDDGPMMKDDDANNF